MTWFQRFLQSISALFHKPKPPQKPVAPVVAPVSTTSPTPVVIVEPVPPTIEVPPDLSITPEPIIVQPVVVPDVIIPPIPSEPIQPPPLLITVAQLTAILPSLKNPLETVTFLSQAMMEFEVATPLRIAAFIAQTAHESAGYAKFSENLNYSAARLTQVFPVRFPAAIAAEYGGKPEKIANRAYAGKIGNGDEASGDGWKFRGRGIIQITGRANYKDCGIGLNLDLITSPELLEQPIHAFRSGAWWWKNHNLNASADKQDIEGITKIVNGGLTGIDERKKFFSAIKNALGIV